jgi:glycosyltransferase involved in cell wall biosynthesis
MPKVSICIPAYKQVEFLECSLNSVMAQDFTDFELIVSDDSPGNEVRELLDGMDLKGKLRYFKNDPALGSPANWNFAMKQAKGEYIKILHHDDLFLSSSGLSGFVRLLDENKNAAFAFSGTEIDLLNLKMKKTHYCSSSQFRRLSADPACLFFVNYIGAPSATIIRNNDPQLFDENLKWLVDVDWYIRCIRKGGVVYTKEPLICTIHGGEGQITQTVQDDRRIQVKEHVFLLEKLYTDGMELKKYSLLFQVLFNKYNVRNMQELNVLYPVPGKLESFFTAVFSSMNNAVFMKKLVYWIGKHSVKDHLFTLKTWFR